MRLPRLTDISLYWICIAVLAAALVDAAWLHWAAPADAGIGDAMQRLRAASVKPDPAIVIVDIDDRSLDELKQDKDGITGLGRFPWPRYAYGELVAELRRQGARAIVFDIELYEPDRQRRDSDEVLNESLVGSTNTFFPIHVLDSVGRNEGIRLADYAATLGLARGPRADPELRVPLELPFVIDRGHWARTGIINFLEDADGTGRRYWLARDLSGWKLPSLPARVAQAQGWPLPEGDTLGIVWPEGTAAHAKVAFFDVYGDLQKSERKRPRDEFKDKIVLLGASATYLGDLRATPIAATHPGIEILATALDNLKNGRQLRALPEWGRYVLVVALFLPMFWVLRTRGHLVKVFAILVTSSLLLVGGAYAALATADRLLPIGTPLVFAWLFFLLDALRAYLKEQRAKEQREAVLSRFLDVRLVKQLVADGVKIEDFKSETRTITVLFSDIRGFTSLSETRPPVEIVDLLNRYLSMQAETVFRHGGTLDKFIGDAIMALWNAPTTDAAHARHAIDCALDMVKTLERFNAESATGIKLDIGIGIHSGPAVVGFIGSKRKLEYTAIGDTVNLASRIEGETKGRTRVLVTSVTRALAGEAFRYADWGEIVVKGRAAAVNVFAPEAPA